MPGALAPQPTPAQARDPRTSVKTQAPADAFESAAPAQARLPRQVPLTQKQQRAYDDLSQPQRARYDQLMSTARALPEHPHKAMEQVRELLGRGGGFKHFYLVDQAIGVYAGRPGRGEAPAALERLLFSGRLTQDHSRLGQSTLEHLGVLAPQKETAMNVSARGLLADVILDLSYPSRIQQGLNNDDCGGTAAAIIMARDRPSEYARILTELGTKGQTAIGEKTWMVTPLKDTREEGGSTRSLSQRLFASTYVDQTNNEKIQPEDKKVQDLLGGEFGREMAKGLSALTERSYKAAFVPTAKESSVETHRAAWDTALHVISQHLDQKATVAINVNHHWVVATNLTMNKDGEPRLRYVDGSGQGQWMSLKDLRKGIQGFVFDQAISTVPTDMMRGKYDKPGTGGDSTIGTQPTGSKTEN